MILLILSLLFQTSPISVYATETNKTYYARVLFDQVYLYKTPTENNDYNNIYFELPKTYFVELISKENDFYQARYLDFVGYVKKESVQAVSSTPNNPFLTNINFRVYAELSQTLRSSPTTQTNNILTQIPILTRNITYIGKINGECLIEGRTSVWYYCKFSSSQEYFGYVYSDFCDEMPSLIPTNSEDLVYINNPSFDPITAPINTIPQTSNAVGIVICILSIPAIIFILLIMKGTRFSTKGTQKTKEVIDY